MRSRNPIRLLSLPALLTAAGLVGAGCDYGSSSPAAEAGLTTRAEAQVATSASAVRCAAAEGAASSASSGSDEKRPAVEDASSDEQAKARAPEPQLADLKIKRLLLARDVDAREPVGPADSFALDEVERIYAFVEVNNRDQVESEIFVTFEPEKGPARGHVRLPVGASPRWRTWAYTRGVRKAGKWSAVVRNAEGELLARRSFEVKPAAAEPSDAPTDGAKPGALPAQRDESVAATREESRSRG